MNLEIITKEDFKEFKSDLLTEIRQLMRPGQGQSKKWLKSCRSPKAAEHIAGNFAKPADQRHAELYPYW